MSLNILYLLKFCVNWYLVEVFTLSIRLNFLICTAGAISVPG